MSAGTDSASPTPSNPKSAARLAREFDLLSRLRDTQERLFVSVRSASTPSEIATRVADLGAILEEARLLAARAPEPTTPTDEGGTDELRETIAALRTEIRATAHRSIFLTRKASSWVEGQVHWLVEWAERQSQGAVYGPGGPAVRDDTAVSSGVDRSV